MLQRLVCIQTRPGSHLVLGLSTTVEVLELEDLRGHGEGRCLNIDMQYSIHALSSVLVSVTERCSGQRVLRESHLEDGRVLWGQEHETNRSLSFMTYDNNVS